MQSQKCPQCNLVNFATSEKCKRCDAILVATNNSESTVLTLEWYYSHDGKRIGPVNTNSITQLVGSGTVTGKTLVWQNGMPDWIMAHQTDLASLFALTRNEPPPLMGEEVNNNLVWVIAFAPIISAFLRVMLGAMFGMPSSNLWWIAIIINVSLCVTDISQLKNAGHNTKNMGIWALLFMPAYLFVRASRLRQNNSYAIAWVISFFISIFIF